MTFTLLISVELIHLLLKLGLCVLFVAVVIMLCCMCFRAGEEHQLEMLRLKRTKE